MCSTCGCESGENGITIKMMGENNEVSEIIVEDNHHHHHHGHDHDHIHGHSHHHHHHHHEVNEVDLEKDILSKNQLKAERNRGFFEALNIYSINMVSSPGSGKTSLLEKTIRDLKDKIELSVIEGDQQTSNDAERIHQSGVPVIQINTGKGCHLDSEMVSKSLKLLQPKPDSVLIIENVGNLVCPAMFDLGESVRIVIVSVTEGEDKPIKYPDMFHTSQICIINKIDLLPHLNFDLEKLKNYALQVNPEIKFFELSATTGEGMDKWYEFLQKSIK
ncbi:MAG: hydrogenase nickel incorporation protein HypB [Flavobacteriaceae bacterium]|jgi:hydrogenase nickel incorporation protein HypB|nr:hydrogenase nickel incorporation protein HypB [Flavobacteriaceae bacterium]